MGQHEEFIYFLEKKKHEIFHDETTNVCISSTVELLSYITEFYFLLNDYLIQNSLQGRLWSCHF